MEDWCVGADAYIGPPRRILLPLSVGRGALTPLPLRTAPPAGHAGPALQNIPL